MCSSCQFTLICQSILTEQMLHLNLKGCGITYTTPAEAFKKYFYRFKKKERETHAIVGKVVAIRVGHHLQEDVHLVEDGGESGVTSIISHNLHTGM